MLRLASALMNDLNGTPKEQDAEVKLDQMTIHKWLSKSSLLNELFSMLSRHIFQFPMTIGKHLLPLCRNLPSKVYPSVSHLSCGSIVTKATRASTHFSLFKYEIDLSVA